MAYGATIATLEELNELLQACGCCQMPANEEPRKECESITAEACGFTIPEHESAAPEDLCKLWTRRESKWYEHFEEHATSPEQHLVTTRTETTTWERVNDFATQSCVERKAACTLNTEESNTEYYLSGNIQTEFTGTETNSWTYASDPDWDGETPNGTFTYSQTDYPDEEGAEGETSGGTEPTTWCESLDYAPDDTWTFSAGAESIVFTFDDSPGPSGDVTDWTITRTVTYSDPVTVELLNEQISDYISSLGPEDSWPGSDCDASLEEDEACGNQPISLTKVRYKFGVPEGFAGSVFELQWDEVFFPAAWTAWDDGGQVGSEPTPGPSLVNARSWTYGGMDEWSDWFTMDAPASEGVVKVVNLLAKSYVSKYGSKPSSFGETIDLGP